MKNINITPEWCLHMSSLEEGSTPGSGLLAMRPTLAKSENGKNEETRIVLSKYLNMARRNKGLSVEELADAIDVEVSEVLSIENNIFYQPAVRTIWKLSEYFNVSQEKMMMISGLTNAKNDEFEEEAVRYAARSAAVNELSDVEKIALDSIAAILGK